MKIDLVENLGYVLDPSPITAEELRAKPAFKIGFRRYIAAELPEGRFLLKDQTTAEATDSMVKRLKSSAYRMGLEIELSEEVAAEIEAKREYAEERSRAGIEIKACDPKYDKQFEEYSSVVDSAFERKLRPRQMRDSFFMCAMGKSGNFSVPGSGKTASVLGVFAFLEAKELASRVIVICPKSAFESWRNEFTACFGGKKGLYEFNTQTPSFVTLPREERKRRLKTESGGCNLILVNYEATPAYVDELKEISSQSTLLVFDEVHRVKRIGGKWATAALEIAYCSERTIALTGTPIPNTYLDIYNFLRILFPREYETFFNFTPAMLRNPSEYEVVKINTKIQPFFCRTTKDDLGVPPANPDVIQRLYVDSETEQILDVLKMRYRKNMLTFLLRVLQLETNPLMLLDSLDTAEYSWLLSEDEETGEIDYVDYSDEIEGMIRRAPASIKVERCVGLANRLHNEGKRVIIWCIFVKSMLLLADRLEQMGMTTCVVYGNTAQEDRERSLERFRNGKIDILITNPHTLAESVSLHSVCHDAIYYEYSFNLVHLLQSKDRIHRLGLPDGQYTQYFFLQDVYDNYNDGFSLDANIYERLKEKEKIMLEAIADHHLEVMPTTEEDLEAIFGRLFD